MQKVKITIAMLLLFILPAPTLAFDPSNPAAFGYSLVFDDEFDSLNTIDINATGARGYNWYVTKFFSAPTTLPGDLSISSGVLTISPSVNSYAYHIATAAPASNALGYVGRVFGGGKGFYIEARMSFDDSLARAHGSPAFWAEALQHGIGNDQWPGQSARYTHFAEIDFLEYNTYKFMTNNSFGSYRHDWYGTPTCTGSFYCVAPVTGYMAILLPFTVTWTDMHVYGYLYTPGSVPNGNMGSIQVYFDGKPYQYTNGLGNSAPFTWIDQGDGTPPPNGTFQFSIIDKQSFFIILGTSVGAPLNVDYIRIWEPTSF